MIAYKNRFHGHGSLDYTYRKGETVRTKYFNFKYITNKKRTDSRIAVVVSKKIYKSAVRRNTIRRRLYEIIRLQLPNFSETFDLIILATTKEILGLSHQELKTYLEQALQETGIIKTHKKTK